MELKDIIFNNLMGIAKRQSQAVLGGVQQKDKRLQGKFWFNKEGKKIHCEGV